MPLEAFLVIALSIGLYSLNDRKKLNNYDATVLLPRLSGFILLTRNKVRTEDKHLVIAPSIGLYPLNPNSQKSHKQLLPDAICVAKNHPLLTTIFTSQKSSLNNHFTVCVAKCQDII